MKELLAFLGLGDLAGKLSVAQKCLAHAQASKIISDLESDLSYHVPYSGFTSTFLLSVGDKVTRDHRPGEKNGLMTIFPLQLRKAEKDDPVIGTVLQVREGKNALRPEYGGLYLEEGPS